MPVIKVLAEVAVNNLNDSQEWYAQLLGKSADESPMPSLAIWHLTSTGSLQVWESAENAGHGLATLMVDDLEAEQKAIQDRGVTPVSRTETSAVGTLSFKDADSNTIIFSQSLASSSIASMVSGHSSNFQFQGMQQDFVAKTVKVTLDAGSETSMRRDRSFSDIQHTLQEQFPGFEIALVDTHDPTKKN